jgi:NitT/TauT family transport system permease protein
MAATSCPLSPAWQRRFSRLLFLAFLLVVWQIICSLGFWDETLLPAPLLVGQTLLAGIADGTIPAGVLASMKRLFIGYGLSLAIGIPLGMVLGRNRILDDTVGSLAVGLQALPSICWLPLAVLWFGLSEAAMQFVVVMGSFMSVTLAIRDGVKSIPPLYIRAARVLGASGWPFYRWVLLPASLPALLTGAKLGWSFAWRSLMAAELLYGTVGIGSTLTTGRELHDMALVVAAMLVIVAIGLLFDRVLFQSGERYLHRRWGTGKG